MKFLPRIILLALALCASAFAQSQFPLSGVGSSSAAPSGAIFTYIGSESGECDDNAASCDITVNTVNGDALVGHCVALFSASTPTVTVSDANNETWNTDFTATVAHTATGSVQTATIASGGAGDVLTCVAPLSSGIVFVVDAYRSSTGWTGGGGGDPTDKGNYQVAATSGPCTLGLGSATSASVELAYGSCIDPSTTITDPTVATGYTSSQVGEESNLNGSYLTARKALSAITTPSFITDGSLAEPFTLILTLRPN